jgi:hypothetical protein
MVEKGVAPEIVCPVDKLDGRMIPWVDKEEKPCLWCLSCNSKLYLSYNQSEFIKNLLHQ